MKCVEHLEESCKSYPCCYGCNCCTELTVGEFIRSMNNTELAKWLCQFVVDTFAASGLADSELEDNSEELMVAWLDSPLEEEDK